MNIRKPLIFCALIAVFVLINFTIAGAVYAEQEKIDTVSSYPIDPLQNPKTSQPRNSTNMSSYYTIWEHLTNPEKALYNYNFNAFYQEFREIEDLGFVKWHPGQNAIIYGRGYDVDELGCWVSIFFNNSIYCMPHYIFDSLVEYDINGNLNRLFGYRGTHYYPDGFAIDKDFIFITGFGDGSNNQKLKRYYFNNATPAPFLLNGILTNEEICGSQMAGCPLILSDGKFLYQTNGGPGILGLIRSRNNLQPVGAIWCNNARASIKGSQEGGIFSSYDTGIYTSMGICEYNLSNLYGNETGLDIIESKKVNFTIPEPEHNERISDGYLFKEKVYIKSEFAVPNLPAFCQSNENCKEDEECRYILLENNTAGYVCKKECNTNSDCSENFDCVYNSRGYCEGNRWYEPKCDTDADCGENIRCLHSFCDFEKLNISGVYYPNINLTIAINIFDIKGTLLNRTFLKYLPTKINETAWILKLRWSIGMYLLGFNENYFVFHPNGHANYFLILNSTLSLISELQAKPASPYAMLPYKAQLFGNGLLDISQWYTGEEVGNIRKPTGELVNNTTTLEHPNEIPGEQKDLCKGSIGGEEEGYYDIAIYNNQKYKLVSFFDKIPGVNVFQLPDELDAQNCTSHADCRKGFYCKTSPWDKSNKKCKKACESNMDCYEMPQDYLLQCIDDGVCSNNANIPCKYNLECNDPHSDNPPGVCIKKFCEKQPQLVKFINFSTIYDYVGWPGGVAVDDSIIPWKMYVNFYWAPTKNGKELGSVRVYSVNPSNNFEWHELGEIIPPTIEPLSYWPYYSNEWWVIPVFGWYYGEIPWLEYPYKSGGVICLVINEQGEERLYLGSGRGGRLTSLLSPKVISACQSHGGICAETCPVGYYQADFSCTAPAETPATTAAGEIQTTTPRFGFFDWLFKIIGFFFTLIPTPADSVQPVPPTPEAIIPNETNETNTSSIQTGETLPSIEPTPPETHPDQQNTQETIQPAETSSTPPESEPVQPAIQPAATPTQVVQTVTQTQQTTPTKTVCCMKI